MSLIAELKRRSVFKVGAAYLVVAWLVIQAASIAMPAFDAPGWVLRVFILFAMLGFPIALVMAWVFDVAPDGMVKVDGGGHSALAFFGVAGALALLSLAWYWLGQPATREGAIDDRSIAVLPFANMSGDPANDYFSDGISEELLNQLAKMPELRVAARTSSFSFKGEKVEIPEIARTLKVRMVLEGSVRKQGERVRITAQLIDAAEGFHVWSETYDRDLKDIFAIQDEIARAISKELKVKLVGGAGATGGAGGATAAASAAGGTADLEAYDLYLRGLTQWQQRTAASLHEAERLFEQAVARDPKFARAWAGIALVNTVIPYWDTVDIPTVERKGRAAASRALELDPDSAEAVTALGNLDRLHTDRMVSATVLLRHAVDLNPSYPTAHQWLGLQLMALGDLDGALRETEIALELDPRAAVIGSNRSQVLMMMGRVDEAEAQCREVIQRNPEFVQCLHQLLIVALHRDDHAALRQRLDELVRSKPVAGARELADAIQSAFEGKTDKRAVALRVNSFPQLSSYDLASPNVLNEFARAYLLQKLGAPDLAVARLAAPLPLRPDAPALTIWGELFDPLRCRADFKDMVVRIGIPDPRAAQVCGAAAKEGT